VYDGQNDELLLQTNFLGSIVWGMEGGFVMKILIVGYFTETSKLNIARQFPKDWNVVIVPPGKEMLRHIEDCQVIIPEHIKVDRSLLSMARKLKLVQTGAGFDNVDIDACTQLGIWVANAAGVNAQAVAEHVMALILSYYKNIPFLDTFMKNKMDESQLDYTGSELAGKTIGIIGFGAIGKKVAEFCRAFDMNVLAYARNPIFQSDDFVKMTTFDDLISESDIVSIHTSLNQQTEQLIDKAIFKKMKGTALFVNTARGRLVNERDLIAALIDGDISGACLDVFDSEPLPADSELRNLSNVILTPHTAGMPDGLKFHKKRYDFFVNNIKRVEGGEEPENNLNQLL
jgi:phosphoglycerate dehydrogenase-like enzyme